MKCLSRSIPVALLLLVAFTQAPAGAILDPDKAPEWKVSEWINGDPGRMADHKGRVVIIEFFQLWCPACNRFAIPLFQRWDDVYGHREDVLIVGIHSVFEGHEHQTPDRLRQFIRERGIRYPVGIDAYSRNDKTIPQTMRAYQTGGSPHVAIIDKQGDLVFSQFGEFDPLPVEAFVDRLLKEKFEGRAKPKAKPERKRGPQGDPALSGRYGVSLEQTRKTCGRALPPMQAEAEVEVLEDLLRARFTQKFINFRELTADYDPAGKTFQTRSRRRTQEGSGQVNLELQVEGRFLPGTDPPQFEATIKLKKRGDDPAWNCDVDVEVTGTRQGE